MDWQQRALRFINKAAAQELPSYHSVTSLASWHGHRDFFKIADNPLLEMLEELAGQHPPDTVEPSVKVSPQGIKASRLNLYYHHISWRPQLVQNIFQFYARACGEQGAVHGAALDYLLDKGFRLEDCEYLVVGLDQRESMNDTRLKIWFALKSSLASMHFYQFPGALPVPDVSIMSRRTYLVGLDLAFSGLVTPKVYTVFPTSDVSILRDRFHLESRSLELAARTPMVTVSLWPQPTLHLLLSGSVIARTLTHPLQEKLSHQSPYILSVLPQEVEAGDIRHFNLYFKSGGVPSALKKDQGNWRP